MTVTDPIQNLEYNPNQLKLLHNSGWKQSPGMALVSEIHDNDSHPEIPRLKSFVQEVLRHFGNDQRILLWDIYNEPGQFGIGDKSLALLKLVWEWALEVRPSQPITACLDGSVGEEIIELNQKILMLLPFILMRAKTSRDNR